MSFWKVWTNSDHLKQNSQFWNSEENHLIICLCHLCKQTSNETRFVVWPQERIIFQCAKSGIFSSGILMVSLAIWNGNLYPNIWYLALEFLVSNDPNSKRSNRRIPTDYDDIRMMLAVGPDWDSGCSTRWPDVCA